MRIAAPKPVLAALLLLIAIHAVSLWRMIARSRTLDVAHWMPDSMLLMVYAVLLMLLASMLKGGYWARAIYTALLIPGALAGLQHFAELSALDECLLLAGIAAVVMLYLPGSNAWFARKRARAPAGTVSPGR